MNMPQLLLSRAWYALDVAAGVLRGTHCPNCGATSGALVYRSKGVPVFRCGGCRVLFRPAGFDSPKLQEVYYSLLYGNAGVATDPTLAFGGGLAAAMAQEGKDRYELLRAKIGPELGGIKVCVLGCSWGYEVQALRQKGVDAFGVELGASRREFALERLGLEVYPTPREAAAAGKRADAIASSHMLEHVPHVTAFLDEVLHGLRPRIQVHITPPVEDVATSPRHRQTIGREHPLGIDTEFWRHYAAARDLDATCELIAGELVTVLTDKPRSL